MTKDPVCNMAVEEQDALSKQLASHYDGQTYYFCSAECKKSFDEDPGKHAPLIRYPEDWAPRDETEQPLT